MFVQQKPRRGRGRLPKNQRALSTPTSSGAPSPQPSAEGGVKDEAGRMMTRVREKRTQQQPSPVAQTRSMRSSLERAAKRKS